MKKILFTITILVLAVGCKSAQKTSADFRLSTIEDLRDNISLTRSVNLVLKQEQPQYFSIILESQPGTGYSWKEVSNTAPVQAAAPAVLANKDKKPGGVSDTILLYKTTAKGQGVIEFEYRQEWKTPDPHTRVVKVDVTIE